MAPTVMIVEDDEELQEIYALMLEGTDCQILRAYDGVEALEKLEEVTPDLVVLDILMEEMMGDELFLAMKEQPRWADVPVVFASVLPRERCQALLDRDPRTIYLRKPFRREDLLGAVWAGLRDAATGP